MSRWIESFENHPFQNVWQEIKNIIGDVSATDETVTTDIKEIARLNKVVSYLDELISAADPELIPLDTWDQFNQQASNCLTNMMQYIQNRNISHINNANNHCDNLLTYVRPYVLSGKGSAQAAGRAFKSYSDAIDEHIAMFSKRAKEAVNQAENNKNESDRLIEEIDQSKQKISELEEQLLDGDESVNERINKFLEDFEEWHSKISEYHQKLTSGNEEESAIILQIEEAKKKAINNSGSTEEALEETKNLLSGLEAFYLQIFGKKNEEGKNEGGLKKELEIRRNEIEAFRDEQQKTYDALLQEIESLLPGATSAGLASAYKELKDTFNNPIEHYSKLFYGALFGLLVSAFVLIVKNVSFWNIEFIDVKDPLSLFNNLIFKLPILLPLLWLAVFASKRRSEDRRLQQEYAHKEAIAKSYESFKQQIEALKEQDERLKKMLLEKAIAAISFNASTTLDGKHGDKMPLLETVDKLVEKGIR